MKCLQRNSASGRCANQPQGSDTLNLKRGGIQVGTARGAGSQEKDDNNGIKRSRRKEKISPFRPEGTE